MNSCPTLLLETIIPVSALLDRCHERGDRMTCISGLENLVALEEPFPGHEMMLHSDQGSVYSSEKYTVFSKPNIQESTAITYRRQLDLYWMSYQQIRRMRARIQKQTGFDEPIVPRRFRTKVLTDLYDATKDIKQTQAAAGHTTADMTLKHYVKGRQQSSNSAIPIANRYGLTS